MQTWLAVLAMLTLATSPVVASEEPTAEASAAEVPAQEVSPDMQDYEVPPPPPAAQTFEDMNLREGDTLTVQDTELLQGAIETEPQNESN